MPPSNYRKLVEADAIKALPVDHFDASTSTFENLVRRIGRLDE